MDGYSVINKELNEKVEQLQEALTLGHLSSYEEYKFICGQVRGLLAARDIINDLKTKMENEDD